MLPLFSRMDFDYCTDLPACTAASPLPDAAFREAGSTPNQFVFTQDLAPLNPSRPPHHIPVFWEVIGQICHQSCYLTTRGDKSAIQDEPDLSPVASCWLQACPPGTDGATPSREWTQLLCRLEGLVKRFDEAGSEADTGELVHWPSAGNHRDGAGRLQVKYDLVDPDDGRVRLLLVSFS